MKQDTVQQSKITLVTYLNPKFQDEQVKHMVIDQWHLYLALNPVKDHQQHTVIDRPCKEESRRVTYFRTWMQAEGLLR
jgi:hypothetical protein